MLNLNNNFNTKVSTIAEIIIHVSTLTSELSCADARKIFAEGTLTNYDEIIELEARVKQCHLQAHNANNPDDPMVVTMSVDQSENNPKILFRTIRLNDTEKVVNVSKLLIAIGANVEFVGDPAVVSIVYGAASFKVDAYLKAAIADDPMIIFLPQYVVTKEVGKEVFKTIIEGKLDNKLQIVVEDGLEFVKNNPSLLLYATSKTILEGIKFIAPRKVDILIGKGEKMVTEVIVDGVTIIRNVGRKIEAETLKPVEKIVKKVVKKLNPFD